MSVQRLSWIALDRLCPHEVALALQRPQVEVGVMSLQDGGLELAQGGDGVVALLPDAA
jgi:hypothetical protein